VLRKPQFGILQIDFKAGEGFEPVMLGPSRQLPRVASCSRFDYLAREVEDHPGKRVHMSTNPVTRDWSLWPEEHHALEIIGDIPLVSIEKKSYLTST
jgi:hypothetical protein